jgi:hypothetical protein
LRITTFDVNGIDGTLSVLKLPAIIRPGALAASDDIHLVPALIADAGDQAAWRYLEFFAANIRNANTRRAYAHACQQFFAWCDEHGLTLTTIRPVDVARYIETRQQTHSAPDVKQQLAAVRMLFDWLITGQIVPLNPAAAVRGPKHVMKTGETPVLDGSEWRTLIESIPAETLRPARPRAHRDPDLFLCPHHHSAAHEGRGSSAKGRRLAGAASREARQAARDAVPPYACGDAARLH